MMRHASLRQLLPRFALLLLLATIIGGCSGPRRRGDPVNDAITIQRNLERGQELMRDASEFRMEDPKENLKGLPKLLEAETLFQEARRLATGSSKPRLALGNCRALIGYVYYSHYLLYEDQVLGAKSREQVPAPAIVAKRDQNLMEAERWLKDSNQELEFYVRNLMQKYPSPPVYEQLAMNYEFLGNYAAAEEMIHRFMASVQLPTETRRAYQAKARSLRQKRLDEFEG